MSMQMNEQRMQENGVDAPREAKTINHEVSGETEEVAWF